MAVDHIGCGLSDKPSPKDYSYHLAQRVADLREFIETLDLREITLVAHDWGGGIGMGAAVAAPERFSRFVLMNTAAFRAEGCPWPIHLCHLPLLGQVAVQGLNLFVRAALSHDGRQAGADDARRQGRLLGPLRLVGPSRGRLPVCDGHPDAAQSSQLPGASPDRTGAGEVPPAPGLFDLGDARLVFLALVPGEVSGLLSRGPKFIIWTMRGITWWKTPHEQIVLLVKSFLSRHPSHLKPQISNP